MFYRVSATSNRKEAEKITMEWFINGNIPERIKMNHDLLKTVIYDQHEIIKNFQIVEREYEFDINANYVVIGLRRAGKSTLLYKIVQELVKSGTDWNQIIYINFEDERLSEFTMNDFNDILSV